ncbi:MAG: hypothetical protein AB7P03_24360 [Kofleriaceae bacterium]
MSEHLTREELEAVIASGAQEARLGAVLAVGGIVVTALMAASGSPLIIVFTGAMFGGMGMVVHGIHRSRQAKREIASAPDARVITR